MKLNWSNPMIRILSVFFALTVALSACAPAPAQYGSDGKALPRAYKISNRDTGKIQFRMLDSVNALRNASGRAPVELNAQLNAAAATHSQDMARQNRPWHFGSDGSSPIDRIARVGNPCRMDGTARHAPRDPVRRRPQHGFRVDTRIERQNLVDHGDGQLSPAS
jgi:hypothetical protein